MDIHCVYFMCIMLGNTVYHSIGQTANSCKNMLQYQLEYNKWVGLVELRTSPWNETLKLEVKLSLPVQLPSRYVGSIETYRTVKETVERSRSNKLAQFRIRFPIQNPLPKLQQVTINGQDLCTERPEIGSLNTEIRLKYTLYTKQVDTVTEHHHAIEEIEKQRLQYT